MHQSCNTAIVFYGSSFCEVYRCYRITRRQSVVGQSQQGRIWWLFTRPWIEFYVGTFHDLKRDRDIVSGIGAEIKLAQEHHTALTSFVKTNGMVWNCRCYVFTFIFECLLYDYISREVRKDVIRRNGEHVHIRLSSSS